MFLSLASVSFYVFTRNTASEAPWRFFSVLVFRYPFSLVFQCSIFGFSIYRLRFHSCFPFPFARYKRHLYGSCICRRGCLSATHSIGGLDGDDNDSRCLLTLINSSFLLSPVPQTQRMDPCLVLYLIGGWWQLVPPTCIHEYWIETMPPYLFPRGCLL